MSTGIHDVIAKMGRKPHILYTDDEGSFTRGILKTYLADVHIKHIISRSHPHYVERYIRTFKNLLYKRLEDTDKHWVDLIPQIVNVYTNKMASSITKLTPAEASEPENIFDVKLNLEIHRRHTRKYPTIEIGDKVNYIRRTIKLIKNIKVFG